VKPVQELKYFFESRITKDVEHNSGHFAFMSQFLKCETEN